jgi:hypothetical protein
LTWGGFDAVRFGRLQDRYQGAHQYCELEWASQ